MDVTILGIGQMGTAMAERLHEQGHTVTVWNRTAAAAQRLADAGVAAVAGDIERAVADASVVITMVTNGEAALEVASRALPSMREDAVWVQASTVGGEWADRLRALSVEHGRQMLDAPVSGSTDPARHGTLTWLVSGPDEALESARPVLESLSSRILLVGPEQEASRLKLVVNAWMTAATVAMADALVAVDRLGLPRDTLFEVLSAGPLSMPYALTKARMITDESYEAGFPLELALKDVRLIQAALGPWSPLVDVVEDRLQRAVVAGHGRDDVAAVGAVDGATRA